MLEWYWTWILIPYPKIYSRQFTEICYSSHNREGADDAVVDALRPHIVVGLAGAGS